MGDRRALWNTPDDRLRGRTDYVIVWTRTQETVSWVGFTSALVCVYIPTNVYTVQVYILGTHKTQCGEEVYACGSLCYIV